LRVLADFSSSFQEPHPQEGHERLLVLRPSDHSLPTYNHGDISCILQRLRESPPILSLSSTTYGRGPHPFRRGYPRRGVGPGYPRGSQGRGAVPQGLMGTNSRGHAFRRGVVSGFGGNLRGHHVDIIPASRAGSQNLVRPMIQGESSGRGSSDPSGSAQDPVTA